MSTLDYKKDYYNEDISSRFKCPKRNGYRQCSNKKEIVLVINLNIFPYFDMFISKKVVVFVGPYQKGIKNFFPTNSNLMYNYFCNHHKTHLFVSTKKDKTKCVYNYLGECKIVSVFCETWKVNNIKKRQFFYILKLTNKIDNETFNSIKKKMKKHFAMINSFNENNKEVLKRIKDEAEEGHL